MRQPMQVVTPLTRSGLKIPIWMCGGWFFGQNEGDGVNFGVWPLWVKKDGPGFAGQKAGSDRVGSSHPIAFFSGPWGDGRPRAITINVGLRRRDKAKWDGVTRFQPFSKGVALRHIPSLHGSTKV